MADIKSILDGIIDGANNKFPNTMNTTLQQNMGAKTPQTFDAGKFREKLSLYVLSDVIRSMMHDDTQDLDGMIDQSIMRHIRDTYGCGCYDYLCKSAKDLPSPILGDIIQEIDKKTMRVQTKVGETQDDSFVDDEANMKDELKNCESWEELREKLRETVSKKVVEDVSEVISRSNDAPTFEDLDEKIAEKKIKKPDEEQTNESTILRMCGRIVSEGAMHGVQLSTEEGLERAIVEYCIAHMDYLFKQDPIMSGLMFWDSKRPIQESFFDMYKDGSIVQEMTKYGKDVMKGSLLGALIGAAITLPFAIAGGAVSLSLGAMILVMDIGWAGSAGAMIGGAVAAMNYEDKKLYTNTMDAIDDICKILKKSDDSEDPDVEQLKNAIKELKTNLTIMHKSLAYQDFFKTISQLEAACQKALNVIKVGNFKGNADALKDLMTKALKLREELTGESTEELIKKAKAKKGKK